MVSTLIAWENSMELLLPHPYPRQGRELPLSPVKSPAILLQSWSVKLIEHNTNNGMPLASLGNKDHRGFLFGCFPSFLGLDHMIHQEENKLPLTSVHDGLMQTLKSIPSSLLVRLHVGTRTFVQLELEIPVPDCHSQRLSPSPRRKTVVSMIWLTTTQQIHEFTNPLKTVLALSRPKHAGVWEGQRAVLGSWDWVLLCDGLSYCPMCSKPGSGAILCDFGKAT